MTQLSVVVQSHNRRDVLRACLESLKLTLPMSSEVLVVDNGSRDGTPKMVSSEYPHVRLVRNERNMGRAYARNQGAVLARGAYLLFLDPDVQPIGPALKQLVAFLEQNLRFGAVAPRLLDPSNVTLATHRALPRFATPLLVGTPLERWLPDNFEVRRAFARDFDYETDGDVELPSAACLLMRRKALKRDQPFDERLGQAWHEVDLCKRLRDAGWRIGYQSQACAWQLGAHSVRSLDELSGDEQRGRLAYFRKHYGRAGGAWIKACVGITVLDHCVRELWRRAQGGVEIPLGPILQGFSGLLRA